MGENNRRSEEIPIDFNAKFSRKKFTAAMILNLAAIAYSNVPSVQENVPAFLVGFVVWVMVAAVQLKNCRAYKKPESELREYKEIKWHIAVLIAVKIASVIIIICCSLPSRIVEHSSAVGYDEAQLICFGAGALLTGLAAVVIMVSFDQRGQVFNKYLLGFIAVNAVLISHDTIIIMLCYALFFALFIAMFYIVCEWFRIKFQKIKRFFE